MLEYINIFIIHEFLLRVYLTLTDQVDKYRKSLMIYTAIIALVYFVATIVESSVYCAEDHSQA